MDTLLLAVGTALTWWMVISLRRRGIAVPLLTMIACAFTVVSAVWVISWVNSYSPVNVAGFVLHGYGVPGIHWFPRVARSYLVLGALIALGIILLIRSWFSPAGGSREEGD